MKQVVQCLQESSYGESISTLGFGSRVSEITLGPAKRNTESGAIFEAKETARRVEQESERHAREVTTPLLTQHGPSDTLDRIESTRCHLRILLRAVCGAAHCKCINNNA